MPDIPLTEKQKKLAEDNHKLIFAYACKYNIDVDEFYDILAFGLINAARAYNESLGYKFSSIAYKCMDTSYARYWELQNRKSQIPQDKIYYYNNPINSKYDDADYDSDEGTFARYLVSSEDTHDIVQCNIDVKQVFDKLTEKEKTIVKYLYNDATRVEIAEVLGCSHQYVTQVVKRLKKKFGVI